MKRMRLIRTVGTILGVAALLALTGCEAIFTYTPLAGLRRNPASLTPTQRLTAAQDALSSGDPAAIKAAYDAIKTDTTPAAVYETAQLGVELSGIGSLMTAVLDGTVKIDGTTNSVGDFVAATAGLNPTYLEDAGARIAQLNASSYPLTTNDRVMGAVGVALQASATTDPPYDLTNPAVDLTSAVSLLAPAKDSDPYIGQLYTYLTGLPSIH